MGDKPKKTLATIPPVAAEGGQTLPPPPPPLQQSGAPSQQDALVEFPLQEFPLQEFDGNCCQCCGSPCTCCPGWGVCCLTFFGFSSCLFGMNQKRAFGISTMQAVAWGVGFFLLTSFFGIIAFATDYVYRLKCIEANISAAASAEPSQQQQDGGITAAAILNCSTSSLTGGGLSAGMLTLIIFAYLAMFVAAGLAAWRRNMLRRRHNIKGSVWGDIFLWFCCAPCAICQETRTLEVRGVRDGVWLGTAPQRPQQRPQQRPPAANIAIGALETTAAATVPPKEQEMAKVA